MAIKKKLQDDIELLKQAAQAKQEGGTDAAVSLLESKGFTEGTAQMPDWTQPQNTPSVNDFSILDKYQPNLGYYAPQFKDPNPVITNPNLAEANKVIEEQKGVTPQPETMFDKYVNAQIQNTLDKTAATAPMSNALANKTNSSQQTGSSSQKPSAQSQPIVAPTVDTTAIDAIIAQIMSGNYGQDPTTTDRYKMYENMYRQQALREKDNAAAALGGRGYADNMVKAAADQAEYARMSQLPLVADQIRDEQKNDLLTRYNLLKGERDYQQSLADADYKRQLAEREYADDKAYRDWQMDMSEREFAQKYGTTATTTEDRVNQAILSLTSSENFDPSQMETYKAMLKYQGYSDAEIEQIVAGIRNIQSSQFQDYVNNGGYGAADTVNSSGISEDSKTNINAGMSTNAATAYRNAINNMGSAYEFAGVSAEEWSGMDDVDKKIAVKDRLKSMVDSGNVSAEDYASIQKDNIQSILDDVPYSYLNDTLGTSEKVLNYLSGFTYGAGKNTVKKSNTKEYANTLINMAIEANEDLASGRLKYSGYAEILGVMKNSIQKIDDRSMLEDIVKGLTSDKDKNTAGAASDVLSLIVNLKK